MILKMQLKFVGNRIESEETKEQRVEVLEGEG